MRRRQRASRFLGVGVAVVGVSGVAAWALVRATAPSVGVVALAGVAGIVTFAASLTPAFAPRRYRTISTGLVLVGAAVVVATTGQASNARAGSLVVSGAVLFLAAELADSALSIAAHAERRPGVDRWSPTWVLGVAVGSAALSFGVISARGFLAGGGPAALGTGTAAATLIAFLVVLALRTRPTSGE